MTAERLPGDLYTWLVRPLLFRLAAERAHDLARLALRWPALWAVLGRGTEVDDPRLETDLAGMRLRRPVGLAPGFDKSAELLDSLARLGFGYLVVGSITTQPRQGNPGPRLHRYPERLSLANCMGMPNLGLEAAVARLRVARKRACPIIAAVAGFSTEELLQAAAAVEPYADAVEIGLVCRHTPGTERMQELDVFASLARGLAVQRRKPVFVKLPPHHTAAERERTLAMVDLCLQYGLDGVSVSGTREVAEPRLSMGRGGLAGRDTYQDALRIVRDVGRRADGRLAIKASGGVFSGAHAAAMLEAGAAAVELYSAFIYRGWSVAGRISCELLAVLDQRGLARVSQLRPDATGV